MCDVLNTFLKPDVPQYHRVLFAFYSVSTFLSFIVTTMSAASVSDASKDFISKAKHLSETSMSSVVHKFHFTLESAICLTVWKITVIRRSFIVGTIGAIITYAALFFSFDKLSIGITASLEFAL
ncbi:hypothetical protein AVEN_38910-1 [Araneus ventricosus]|uniref:Uncharacterized protein n=1 Tax=Araneus ventricosus TaxID=182803 RepID=A0A4Y2PD99_ARAVE|nr:hypothetical protein AVEN_229112-1 [Araneus ventricosus]GBN48896.1 hypothetical protein AVEN_233863-1 [Araneus ventricosus]GBN48943.1 hypothetical protein AVEN_267840-1 [Araneus ventricosus]GBN48994.1 hypothetical protein AVEN_38910-1 [Araneus ventricosus]